MAEKTEYEGVSMTNRQAEALDQIRRAFGFSKSFTYQSLSKMGILRPAELCRELENLGFLDKRRMHKTKPQVSRSLEFGIEPEIHYKLRRIIRRVRRNPKGTQTNKNTNNMKDQNTHTAHQSSKSYDTDMIALFFGANHFKSKGNKTWEKNDIRVKVVANHKFMIMNTDPTKKHKHIATVFIPKSDEMMYYLFRDLIGMRL